MVSVDIKPPIYPVYLLTHLEWIDWLQRDHLQRKYTTGLPLYCIHAYDRFNEALSFHCDTDHSNPVSSQDNDDDSDDDAPSH